MSSNKRLKKYIINTLFSYFTLLLLGDVVMDPPALDGLVIASWHILSRLEGTFPFLKVIIWTCLTWSVSDVWWSGQSPRMTAGWWWLTSLLIWWRHPTQKLTSLASWFKLRDSMNHQNAAARKCSRSITTSMAAHAMDDGFLSEKNASIMLTSHKYLECWTSLCLVLPRRGVKMSMNIQGTGGFKYQLKTWQLCYSMSMM